MKLPLFLIFGLACTVVGVVWGLKRWMLRRNGVRVIGTVVGFATTGTTSKFYTPTVEFTTDAGHKIRFRGSTGSRGVPPYSQDQRVKVLYSRHDPRIAQIDNFEQFWLGPVSFGLFGLVVLGVFIRENPRDRYWLIVALLGVLGTLFAATAVLTRRSNRIPDAPRKDGTPNPALLAKIDRACELYPEGHEALQRTRTTLVDWSSPADLEVALDGFLDKILSASDRETALKHITQLAKALDRFGKL